MNAILGMDRLRTGIVPLTSVITTVSYGTTEQVILKYQERRLDTEISLKELTQYVTQQGNPGNQLRIATANIELAADILRRGFYFVDTPVPCWYFAVSFPVPASKSCEPNKASHHLLH